MLYANQNNIKALATPQQKAICPYCDAEVIAKCGDIKTWHWAHKNLKECDTWAEGETDWHLQWKSHFPSEKVEVTMKKNGTKHRADAIAHDGSIVEFQHSPISPQEIKEREDFYENMIWVFDVREAYKAKRIYLTEQEFDTNDEIVPCAKRYFMGWERPKSTILYAKKRIIFDLSETKIFLVNQTNVVIERYTTYMNHPILTGFRHYYAKGSLVEKARFIQFLKTGTGMLIINNQYAG